MTLFVDGVDVWHIMLCKPGRVECPIVSVPTENLSAFVLRPVQFQNVPGFFSERYELDAFDMRDGVGYATAEFRSLERVAGMQVRFDPRRLR